MKFNRRLFLALPALAPLRALGFESTDEHRFHYDHLIGTSMDLAVWTKSREAAQYASRAALHEIARLTRILSTYEPDSEIRRLESGDPIASRELAEVIELYRYWESKTGGVLSIRPSGGPLNVLGKAYIIDRAAAAIRKAAPEVRSLVLNIGGDIVVWGRDCEIDVTDPSAPRDTDLSHSALRTDWHRRAHSSLNDPIERIHGTPTKTLRHWIDVNVNKNKPVPRGPRA